MLGLGVEVDRNDEVIEEEEFFARDRVIRTFGIEFWTAIPIVSAIAFIAAALKVFRAAGMETSTTVAILSSTDDIELLKGVLVGLLPGFFTGLLALAIWDWSRHLPADGFPRESLRESLAGRRAVAVAILLAIGYFTISLLPYALIFLVTLSLYLAVLTRLWTTSEQGSPLLRWRAIVVVTSLFTAVASVLVLAVATDVWLPLRDVKIVNGNSITIGTVVVRHQVAAYVLESDDKTTTLLLNSPRAVVTVDTEILEKNPAICIPERHGGRSVLQRPSQWIGPDGQFESPYETCPATS